MALAASRGGNCEIDDHGCAEPQPDDTAAVALSALNNLNRAVAVFGPDSRILFSNPLFGELFGGDGRDAELRDLIRARRGSDRSLRVARDRPSRRPHIHVSR